MGLNEWLGDREDVGNASKAFARERIKMMTATETAEARLAGEKNASTDPQPTSVPTNVATSAKPAASHTSAAKYTVSITLDPHVHTHYEKKAKEDDRTLAKYLARELRTIVEKAEKDKNF
jgi:hypothetical protein